MKLKIGIVTVPRPQDYIGQTIESLETSGFFRPAANLPLRISVGRPGADTSYLERYRVEGARVWSMANLDDVTWGFRFDDLNLRQRSTFGHVRAMQIMLKEEPTADAVMICEDDVVFARGWQRYVDAIMEVLRKRHGDKWMLTLFRFTPGIKKSFDAGNQFTQVSPVEFNGCPALIYSRKALSIVSEYLMDRCVRHYDNVNDHGTGICAGRNKIPIYATVPSLVEHIGDVTTGQSNPGQIHNAEFFLPSVEDLPLAGDVART